MTTDETKQELVENPKVKQTLTSVDEKYWYPFGYKLEKHDVTCMTCGHVERSSQMYKVFAHYLYTPHTTVTKYLPIGGDHNVFAAALPVHSVSIASTQPNCRECINGHAYANFPDDSAYRAFVREKAAHITAEARRSNALREIFGGPPARKTPSATQSGPKVSLSDFLKDM